MSNWRQFGCLQTILELDLLASALKCTAMSATPQKSSEISCFTFDSLSPWKQEHKRKFEHFQEELARCLDPDEARRDTSIFTSNSAVIWEARVDLWHSILFVL